MFEILTNCQTFPQGLSHFTFLLTTHKGSNFSRPSPMLVIFLFKNSGHSGGCEEASHCGFGLSWSFHWEMKIVNWQILASQALDAQIPQNSYSNGDANLKRFTS